MTAFRATYSDFRLVKGRKVAQFVLEVPLEQADAALRVLGGMPKIGEETWVGVAPLVSNDESLNAGPAFPSGPTTQGSGASTPDAPAAKRKWHELKPSQQAGIRCADPEFQKWIGATTAEDAAVRVRQECDVDSLSELNFDLEHARRWQNLDNAFLTETGRATEQR